MGCASLIATPPPGFLRPGNPRHLIPQRLLPLFSSLNFNPGPFPTTESSDTLICQTQNSSNTVATEVHAESHAPMTGGAYDFKGATMSLTDEYLSTSKKVTIVRHGLSTWNEESKVQGSSDLSVLTNTGIRQAEKCRNALTNMSFDICFSSPITRAKSTAELIWHGREEPLVFLDSLKEAHLFYLEGVKNADARKKYPEYVAWREDPANFCINGVYPIRNLWGRAREAWREILSTPGENILVVTHKSIKRALICTALGLGPERFRSIDINNGGISVFTFNKRGEAMLESMNMTAHMYSNHVYQHYALTSSPTPPPGGRGSKNSGRDRQCSNA